MDEYLRMDGLTFKLVPYHAEDKVAEQKLEKNLSEIFQYRNLDNPKVYLNDNVIGLLQNYRAAFLRLAHQYLMEKNNEGVVRILKKMEQVVPFDVIPAPDIRLPLQVGQYYQFAGRIDEFLRLAEFTYQTDPENPEVVGIYVSLLQHHKRYQDAIAVLSEWQIDHPADSEAQNKILELQRQVSAPDSVIQ
ncbi:MAG: tetratricopeptide repeat protein [Calditrichaeota bacterium]|nr:MAG: tetratricopeptide repeat protein [Calditrichota bacterium]